MPFQVCSRLRPLASIPPAIKVSIMKNLFHTTPLEPKTKQILDGILGGNRTMLARGITLVESTRLDHRAQAQSLIYNAANAMKSKDGHRKQSTFRIGLSGPPGAGKSTFIESFGLHLTRLGHKVAVLAVDPSSSRTGGSILGDKTRMDLLSREPNAFIRPSPSRCTLGGVARNTNEAIVLCEAAGYDTILIETVGVGQSETTVADMVDLFTLLMPPAAGDELQGIKRGIVELAQLVLVNKADGDLLPAARRAAAEVISALKILRPMKEVWNPKVVLMSAREKQGIDKAWDAMCEFREIMQSSGELDRRRANQRRVHMWNYINTQILEMFQRDSGMKGSVETMERGVIAGNVPPGAAADMLIGQFLAGHANAPIRS